MSIIECANVNKLKKYFNCFKLLMRENQIKNSNIHTLVHQYELFNMKDNEIISEMFTRFMNIINDLRSLGKV